MKTNCPCARGKTCLASWRLMEPQCPAGVLTVLELSASEGGTSEEEVALSCNWFRAPLLSRVSLGTLALPSPFSSFVARMSHGLSFVSDSVSRQDLKSLTLSVAEFVGLRGEEKDGLLEAEIHAKVPPNLIS